MKTIKRIIAMMICSILVMTNALDTYAANRAEDAYYYEKMMHIQENAVKVNEKVCMLWGFDEIGCLMYPDNVGGAWIDYDKLVIGLTEITESSIEYYKKHLKEDYKYIRFEKVKFSYNELTNIMEKLVTRMNSINSENKDNVVSYSIDEMNNLINIGVKEDILDVAKIIIQEENEIVNVYPALTSETLAVLYAGQKGKNYRTDEQLTFSCSGYYNSQNAILTCGHNRQLTGDSMILTDGTYIGSVILHRFYNNSYGDFEVVSVSSPHSTSNYCANGTTIQATVSSPAQNMVVAYYGVSSGYTKYGIVESRNVTDTVSYYNQQLGYTVDTTVNGYVKVSVSNDNIAIGGDSGGPFFTTVTGGVTSFCGVLSASNSTDLYVLFTPYSYVFASGFSAKIY